LRRRLDGGRGNSPARSSFSSRLSHLVANASPGGRGPARPGSTGGLGAWAERGPGVRLRTADAAGRRPCSRRWSSAHGTCDDVSRRVARALRRVVRPADRRSARHFAPRRRVPCGSLCATRPRGIQPTGEP
jgi:hypothetical protein